MSFPVTTFYYGYRMVDPVVSDPPYNTCIFKGVVFHWNTTGTKPIEIYRSWRTFSSTLEAANDAHDWIVNAPLDVVMTSREFRHIMPASLHEVEVSK